MAFKLAPGVAIQGGKLLVRWNSCESAAAWYSRLNTSQIKQFWRENGYCVVHEIIPEECLKQYQTCYGAMHGGEVDASNHRHDLGSHEDAVVKGVENTGQIMWPSLYIDNVWAGPLHQRSRIIAQMLMGDDISFDFDMLIYKDGSTLTDTPWHQDEGYWPRGMEDKRAVSVWTAMDHTTVENGCMWFVPGSQDHLREHKQVVEGKHVLTVKEEITNGVPVPLTAGSCTFHSGKTLHYAGPNTTDFIRRGYIINYRPQSMIEYERSIGFDHAKSGLENITKSYAEDGRVSNFVDRN